MNEVSNNPPKFIRELRCVGGGPVVAGHYDDDEVLLKHALELSNEGRNVYWTQNPIRPDRVYGLNEAPKPSYRTAEDKDMERIVVLLYDIDPERLNPDGSPFRLYELPDGSFKQLSPAEVKKFNAAAKLVGTPKLKRVSVAGTDAEKNSALAVARKIFAFWKARGADVKVVDSGNGYYVIVRVDLAIADKALIADILEQHAEEFDTPFAEIDTSASNPSRITRVPDTVNRKGPNSPERPHRVAKVIFHQEGRTFSAEDLRAMFPVKERPADAASAPVSDEKQKESCEMMEGFLDHHDIGHAQRKSWKGGYIYHLDEDEDKCPNGEDGENSHSTENLPSTISVMVSASGKLGYKCCHGNCSKLTWREFRDFHERAAANRQDGVIKAYELAVDRGESPVFKLKDFRGPFFKSDVDDANLPKSFVWTSRKSSTKEEQRSQSGPLWLFSTEEEYAVFKNRVEQTPAWAFEYRPGTDPDFWGQGATLNTDYEAWKATRGAADAGWRLVSYSDITATKVDWLWKGYLATGKLTMINGEPGSGKSLITVDTAARVTTGRDWSDGSKNLCPPSAVLLLTEEEDAGDTIKPRFLAAGGNANHLITLNVGKAGLFQIETDTGRLQKAIESAALPIRLVILDPVADYTSVDPYKDAEVRPMLNKLREFGAEIGAAVIGVNHLNKKTDLGPIHRVSGARGWVSFARLNFLVGAKDNFRHVVPLKTNIAKDGGSLTFTIGSESVTDGDIVVDEVAKVMWQSKGTLTAADLMAANKSPKDPESESSELEACVRKLLSGKGWYSAPWVIQEADERGWNKRSVQRMVAKLGVEGRWTHDAPPKREWRMAPRPTEQDEALKDFNPGIASSGTKGEVNV